MISEVSIVYWFLDNTEGSVVWFSTPQLILLKVMTKGLWLSQWGNPYRQVVLVATSGNSSWRILDGDTGKKGGRDPGWLPPNCPELHGPVFWTTVRQLNMFKAMCNFHTDYTYITGNVSWGFCSNYRYGIWLQIITFGNQLLPVGFVASLKEKQRINLTVNTLMVESCWGMLTWVSAITKGNPFVKQILM